MSDASNLNLVRLTSADSIKAVADSAFSGRPFRLALAGYSAPPDRYEPDTKSFLQAVVRELGSEKVGLITSPTADKGSIDAIGTEVAASEKTALLYVTAEDYVGYINPKNFPTTIDTNAYSQAPKYVFPNTAEYSVATARASNVFVATGGRDATVGDFVNALKAGNRAVVLDNLTLGGVNWDTKKNRPNNAARYLVEQLAAYQAGNPLPHPDSKGFSGDFLVNNAKNLSQQVFVVTLHNESEIPEAAKKVAEFIAKSAVVVA